MPATYAIIRISSTEDETSKMVGYVAEHSSDIVNAVAKSFNGQNLEKVAINLKYQARLYSNTEVDQILRLMKVFDVTTHKVPQFEDFVDLDPSSLLFEKIQMLKKQFENMPTRF